MAWPFLTGTVKIVVEITFNGKVNVNVHFATKQGGASVDPTDLVPLADAVYEAYNGNWQVVAAQDAAVSQITAINWEAPNGRQGFTSLSVPFSGGINSDALPQNVALVVSNRTNFTGRSRRGRTYYTGMQEDSVDNNTANAALMSADLGTSVEIGANVALVGYDHVVYSLYADGAPRVTPSAVRISEYTINARVDTQRRRLPSA